METAGSNAFVFTYQTTLRHITNDQLSGFKNMIQYKFCDSNNHWGYKAEGDFLNMSVGCSGITE